MKERPILFSGPMVRAILEGRKTQTRMAIKGVELWPCVRGGNGGASWATPDGRPYQERGHIKCPHGTVGDRLWIRESFAIIANRAWYRADPPIVDGKTYEGPWKPSIHMPRWASRITLEITGVRVERLQEISEKDAMAEGCVCPSYGIADYWKKAGDPDTPSDVFMELWKSINGPESWSANPWVWVIEFRRVQI